MQASLARPSTGGAVSEIFKASPTLPVIAFFFARGCTLIAKETLSSISQIANIIHQFVILSEAKDLCTLPAVAQVLRETKIVSLRMTMPLSGSE